MANLPEVPAGAGGEVDERRDRDRERSRRKRTQRSRTESTERMSLRERVAGRLAYPEADRVHALRPKTRGECEGGARPCPFVSCKFNLYLDVSPDNGSIQINFPDLEPEDVAEDKSCLLDVVEDGPVTLERVGELMNVTRERIRQIEVRAMKRALPLVSRMTGEGCKPGGTR